MKNQPVGNGKGWTLVLHTLAKYYMKVIWEATVAEILECRRERGNQPSALLCRGSSQRRNGGQLCTAKISQMCSPFLRRGKSIALVKLHEQGSTQQTYLREVGIAAMSCADGTDLLLIDSL